MLKNLLIVCLVFVLCGSSYAQQIAIPVTTHVPQTIVTPMYSTVYVPVTNYYIYNSVVTPPIFVYPQPQYYMYSVPQRVGFFGCYKNYSTLVPTQFYGNQNIRSF